MESRNSDKNFSYVYSAKEQDEIRRIRQKYQMKEEDGISKLRKMDAKVSQKATTISLIFGIVGTLIMGIGMSLVMTDLGSLFGLSHTMEMVLGVIIGLVGIIIVILAYPVYNKTLKKEREKIAPEIMKLTEELMR